MCSADSSSFRQSRQLAPEGAWCNLEDSNRECAGFLIMPKRPHEWNFTQHPFKSSALRAVLRPMAPVSPRQVRSQLPSQPPPALTAPCQYQAQVGPHPSLFAAAPKRSASTAPCGNPHCRAVPSPVLVVDHSLSPCLPFLPMVRQLANPSHLGMATSTMQTGDHMRHQYRLSVLQWNPGPARS